MNAYDVIITLLSFSIWVGIVCLALILVAFVFAAYKAWENRKINQIDKNLIKFISNE